MPATTAAGGKKTIFLRPFSLFHHPDIVNV
jgi:hypothetical protein